MTRPDAHLVSALALSLLLHLLPVLANLLHLPPPPPVRSPPLQAELRPTPPPPPQAPLELTKPEPASPSPAKSRPPAKTATSSRAAAPWVDEVRRQFKKQSEAGLFYPAEAIAQGLEGEATVLLILDEHGQVAAARLEQGSGWRILDEAALRAVRALHSVPSDAPRETLLPVRFRLK
ncbi:MAG: TonB family protein [Bacteroidota bacterium]